MSCIAMSVGLGNIWRFPFTAYENGGGAFLIPYIIVLFVIGKPVYYLEMTLGQFTSKSSVKIWALCPILKGIGIGQIISTCCVVSYYCCLMALTLFYLYSSFASDLPWSYCKPEWEETINKICVDSAPSSNSTTSTLQGNLTRGISSSELFFVKEVLKENKLISSSLGLPDVNLTICLFVAWLVVFLVLVKGVSSSGKVSYFLAIFPYVVMIALLIRAATLEGAGKGILFFIEPQWGELLNPKVWHAAVTQACFSLSLCNGAIIMFSSYNKFDNNVYRDVLIVTTLDTFTSLLAGTTIFGILGNLAHNLNIDDIGQVIQSGTGLAFISYPDAISKFDMVPQVFSVLFFFMLFVLGVGSAVALHGAIITVISDQFGIRYWKVALAASTVGFLIGLVYVTPEGQWLLNLVDYFGATFLIFALAIIQNIGVFWIYGLENYCLDVEFMVGVRVGPYWRICWGFVTPVLMTIIFIYSLAVMKPLKYSELFYPDSYYAAGWTMLAVGILQVPLWAIWIYLKNRKHSINDTLKNVFTPNEKWGPKSNKIRKEWIKFKTSAKERREAMNLNLFQHVMYSFLGKYKYND
ncbi:sodium-dependent nutrient amino acid transporter 1-like [Ctenocephalides felis]|uniref:sodium-dependent nutrient amino acid transporter 1-like n=1 Tax=Ctenocephalides felis TaxID=7515 RepID=UPI000E6E53FB|nr:sodium-dependent nutrient amino acid transporter 1-like [Ctenocephalides felis]